jgi:4-hydroxythreonine-4-phosphate dehydrogenase
VSSGATLSSAVVVALTPGEPAGIGPDITVALAQSDRGYGIVAVADPDLISSRGKLLGMPLRMDIYDREQPPSKAAQTLTILPVELARAARCGNPDPVNARYVLSCLQIAMHGCQSGEFNAMVTGPVHKEVINRAGITFSGHTEYLAEQLNAPTPVMLLTARGLRVALVTTHVPLAKVASIISRERLRTVLEVLHRGLIERFAIADPVICVCGLNPHAGEGGFLGDEEQRILIPVIKELTARGMRLRGPVPADSAFTPDRLADSDAIVAMYHDQGLPVLKHYGFGQAVNVTLGLPIIRTSVDHGTALDLAGTGRASSASLEQAMQLAVEMARRTSTSTGK